MVDMTVETISEMATKLFAPNASSTAGVQEDAAEKSVELFRETLKQVNDNAPKLLVHLPQEDHELTPVVDRIAKLAATIYPMANVLDQGRVKTVVAWAINIYILSRKATGDHSAASA